MAAAHRRAAGGCAGDLRHKYAYLTSEVIELLGAFAICIGPDYLKLLGSDFAWLELRVSGDFFERWDGDKRKNRVACLR
jgi:hypothetical protein